MRYRLQIFLIIVLTSTSFLAQGPESTLIDEFSNPNCEDLWARLDNFFIQLLNNPSLAGTITISGKSGDLRNDLYFESQIKTYFIRRSVSQDRWRIIRTRPEANRTIRFWLTQPGVTPDGVESSEWSLVYPKGTRPFIFAWGDSYADDVCLMADEIALLAQVLKANPNSRINVVLLVRSQREFDRRRKETVQLLVDLHSINRWQFKIFKKLRSKKDVHRFKPNTEYWFVP